MTKLEISLDVIVHATEDLEKFLKSFEGMFGLKEDDFIISNVEGHFENLITILTAKFSKKPANQFLETFLKKLSVNQKEEIKQEIEERTENSTLHIRFDKQEFIDGRIDLLEKEAIKLKIQTPIYNKKDTLKVFSKILENVN